MLKIILMILLSIIYFIFLIYPCIDILNKDPIDSTDWESAAIAFVTLLFILATNYFVD